MTDVVVLDTAAEQPNPPQRLIRGPFKRYRALPNGKVLVRAPETVTGIVVHQTACHFGPAADPARRHDRAHDIPIHAVAFRDGVVALPYPLTWDLYHGNQLNARSLGLEVEGLFAGVEGTDHAPVHDAGGRGDLVAPHPGGTDGLEPLLLETAKRALRELVERGRALGMPIEKVWAHRQSSATRRPDPGELLWTHLVLGYAVPVLGLRTEVDLVVGDGRPVPKEWDPSATAEY